MRQFLRPRLALITLALATPFVAAVVYGVLLRWWPWKWASPLLANGRIDPAGLLSQQLALGQVVLGFAGVLLAAFLGVFAILEFASSRERAQLRLAFHPQASDTIPIPAGQRLADFYLAVLNEGPVVAVWYMVEVSAPLLAGASAEPSVVHEDEFTPNPPPGGLVRRIVGAPAQWQSGRDRDHARWTLTFMSGGSIAAYPGLPLPLCGVRLPRTGLSSGRYTLDYRIATDRDAPRSGQLHLDVE